MPFLDLGASCLKTGMAIIPKSIPTFILLQRFIMTKIQEYRSCRTKVIAWKPFCLHMDDCHANNNDRPIT